MVNKNPKRPFNIDTIISQLLNPKETQSQKNKRIEREMQVLLDG